MHQVLTHSMPPIHKTRIPDQPIRKALPKQMVLPIIPDRPVDIIAPSPLDGKMKLRPVALRIQRVGSVDPVILVNALQRTVTYSTAQTDRLSLEIRDIYEDPVVNSVFRQLNRDLTQYFVARAEFEQLHPGLTADRDIQVMPRNFQVDLLLRMGQKTNEDH